MQGLEIRRLVSGDEGLARETLRVMAEVFEEERRELAGPYLSSLLGRTDFWALAALAGDRVVGGVTAHSLPMTRSQESELFIYDLAVHLDYQRRGVGRALMAELQRQARQEGMRTAFVLADGDDTDAQDFYRAIDGKQAAVAYFLFT